MNPFDSSKYGMKYLNIECQRFSVAQNSNYQENRIEIAVEADQKEVIGQFSAKEIVEHFHYPDLLSEIGFEMCLEHFYGVGNHDHVLSVAASAPDMLEVLETIKRRMYEPRALMLEEVESMIDKVIAKAKGDQP